MAVLRERLRERGLPVSGLKADLLERLSGRSFRITATKLAESKRRAVREAVDGAAWEMSLDDWYVRPPKLLPRGGRNPICQLGECGDELCALYRFKSGCEQVRSEFLEFCVRQIMQRSLGTADGITYCTLGCGCLYFDWELIDRLVHVEGLSVAQIWLVEKAYRRNAVEHKPALRARKAFSSWFAGLGIEVHAFRSAKVLRQWVQAFPAVGRAHVVVQCDAVDTAPILDSDGDFCRAVTGDGALNLQAYSQLLSRRRPGPGRRRDPVRSVPVRRVRERQSGGDGSFRLLEEDSWRDGRWVRAEEEEYQRLLTELEEEYR